MMYDYCEVPEFFHGTWPKARKQHTCCECGDKIAIGEVYCRSSGKFDGAMFVECQHLECEEACRYIRDFLNGGECIAFGELFEFVGEVYGTLSKSDDKNKTFRRIYARAKWRNEKRRPLTWLGPLPKFNQSLENDRAKRFY